MSVDQKPPIFNESGSQQQADDVDDNLKELYEKLCTETKGHYHVGTDPKVFLDNFLPWNETTPDGYKLKTPLEERIALLKSVPPSKDRLEGTMFKLFVNALDKYVSKDELVTAGVRDPRTLRVLHSQQPDSSCDNFNVNISTYWEDELPSCTTFQRQQTSEEIKPGPHHDAFQHKLDEFYDGSGNGGNGEAREKLNGHSVSTETCAGMRQKVERRGVEQGKQQEEQVAQATEVPKQAAWTLSETTTNLGRYTRGQIAASAGLALSMNFRKHFFSILILGPFARFIRWDRCGAIVTYRFNYYNRPELIFEFYRRYGQLSIIQRGLDPTATRKTLTAPYLRVFNQYSNIYGGADFRKISAVNFTAGQDCFHVAVKDSFTGVIETFVAPPPRFNRNSFMPFSRGTKRSLACLYIDDENPGEMFFLKDSWQKDSTDTTREAEIYRRLKTAKVQYVASMRMGGDVDSMVTENQGWLSPKLRRMICHRIVLETIARSLTTFVWCKVLLSCIADAVEGAQQAYKAGILHRDLSAGNIMIVRNKTTNEWNGVLVDWDMCILWRNPKSERKDGRTGTLPFMSAKIQLTPRHLCMHTLWDDIESAFWVLLHHVLFYTRHKLGPQSLYNEVEAIFFSLRGDGKRSTLLFCANRRASHVTTFNVPGLTRLLNELGPALDYRYNFIYDDGDNECSESSDNDNDRSSVTSTNATDDRDDSSHEDADADELKEHENNHKFKTGKDERSIDSGKINRKPKSKFRKALDAHYINLDDPDEKWFPNLLRKAALKMKPYNVTPRALKSLQNNSEPPMNSDEWEPADVAKQNDFCPMPWAVTFGALIRGQQSEYNVVCADEVDRLDGISIINKRPLMSDQEDEEEPLRKKQRLQT